MKRKDYWKHVKRVADEVKTWPAWKQKYAKPVVVPKKKEDK